MSARGQAARIRALLPPGATHLRSTRVQRLYSVITGQSPRKGGRPCNLVYAQSDRIASSRDLDEALRALEGDIRLYVAEHSRRFVFIHAGVVAWQGQAIVIPGRSHSGKSRLVAALLEAGATYYSDEYAPIDARGRVHSYLQPLRLRQRSGARPKRVIATRKSHSLPPLPVGLLVATTFEKGARWHHRALTPGRAALEVLKHAVPARRSPERVLNRLAKLTAQAPLVKGRRGEARAAASRVLQLAQHVARR